MNIKGGIGAPIEDLEKKGYNNSLTHVDFMFGSSDLEIVGITQDGKYKCLKETLLLQNN